MAAWSKSLDIVFHYRGSRNIKSKCRLRVYEAEAQPHMVIATQLPDNPGASIVAMPEYLAWSVWVFLERPSQGLIWIEHITNQVTSAGFQHEETFSLVNFLLDQEQRQSSKPEWHRLSKAFVTEMTGDNFCEVNQPS